MKQTHILFITLILSILQTNAQIPLKGAVSVQNSKTNTGQTEYVSNAQVACDKKAQPKTSDSKGEFTLEVTGRQNEQIAISVVPKGKYENYVVVNEKEINDLTLGRVTPVSVYICLKGDLELRQAEMVGINMRKFEERMETDKKRLQKELDALRAKNDYMNNRYSEIKDSLDVINKNIDNAFERIKEYAKNMTLENLDDRDENYVKAYNCFARGELDSVSYYLSDNDLELKHQKVLQLQKEAKQENELAAILTESAKAKTEFSENSLNELIKEWLLLAHTADMQNNYEKAKTYYEKTINADTSNVKNLFEYANYLHKIKEYANAEKYYRKCLEIYWTSERENPKTHLPDIAETLNYLALIHKAVNEYTTALKECEEALEIHRGLAEKDPNTFLPDVATTLNTLANLHSNTGEHQKASAEYAEALKIRRKLANENPKLFLSDVAITLNNLAILHAANKEDTKALEEYEEALKICRELANEDPKTYLPNVAMTLNNLANVHITVKEYPKALEEYTEALKIRRKLADENPKTYLSNVATTLNNLGTLHSTIKEYPKALEEFEEVLEIYRNLVVENPKAYTSYVAKTLNNLAILHKNINKYPQALEELEEALEIYKTLAHENPQVYLSDLTTTSNNLLNTHGALSWEYLLTKEYAQSEQSARYALKLDSASLAKINLAHALLLQNHFPEAEKIYKELSQTIYENNETYTQMLLEDFEALDAAAAIPEERKGNVEKIKEILKQ